MAGVNKVFLVGHLGKDPELRNLNDNVSVVSFPLATSELINRDGHKVEITDWHNIVMWRDLAIAAAKILDKGKLIYLEGKIHTRSFNDNNGQKKYATEVIAESFTLLGRGNDFEPVDELSFVDVRIRRMRISESRHSKQLSNPNNNTFH